MEYKTLGKSDLKISRISLGCMSLTGSIDEAETVIAGALEAGINYFDTADLYESGANESKIGTLLQRRRKDVVIATKVGNQMRADGSGWDWNPSKEYILKSVEGSLKRLKTDYIDLYQLHGGTLEDPIDETIEAFEILKEQGKIRFYGISSIRPNVISEYVAKSNIVSVMMQFSLLDRRPEEKAFNLLEENGISVLARGVVAQGLLAGKEVKAYLERPLDEVAVAARAVREVSGEKRTLMQTALLYVLSKKVVASAVFGTHSVQHLSEATSVFNVPPLAPDELQYLDEQVKPNLYTVHR
ncbi:aldo/keto reductase [Desertivirga brevis]|uniref:aldo/keto reductase n=1 Tax=Desertivirga brevis TaxID=2810310 RepID=UPI001A97A19A|nr:aldo/keto reductase [Pedobacter sp. SYSU D00873]